jgi:hypothetical protein
MSRVALILSNKEVRQRACAWVMKAPEWTRFELKDPKRTLDQNACLWSWLTEIARTVEWHGVKLGTDDWKRIFMAALNREMRIVPNLDGTGFVNLGQSSSDLSKEEMSDLLELIAKFAAERGVVLPEQSEAA